MRHQGQKLQMGLFPCCWPQKSQNGWFPIGLEDVVCSIGQSDFTTEMHFVYYLQALLKMRELHSEDMNETQV